MTPDEARAILRAAYGDDPVEVEEFMCFGDCCLRSEEKKALVTLIYSEQVSGNGEPPCRVCLRSDCQGGCI